MNKISLKEVQNYVQKNIATFHQKRLESLANTNLKTLLKKKNPYLFKAKNIVTAQDLVTSFLDAKLSSSEEEIFGDFLEHLAIFVAQKTLNAIKSGMAGIDLEYTEDNKRVLVSLKSGLNWGNSSQWKSLFSDLQNAIRVLKQSRHIANIECILGVCYGNAKATIKKGLVHQICGQEFWYKISGKKSFYKDIVEPIGYQAKEHNDEFKENKIKLINKLTKELLTDFCDEVGTINWEKLVKFNSGNLEK